MLQVGKLYSCFEYFLLLFPCQETVARPDWFAVLARAEHRPAAEAAYWTRELGKSVSYCNPQTPLLVLSVKEKYIEVLAGDRKGWIIVEDWLGIKEIK
jgi:hypothetical protein